MTQREYVEMTDYMNKTHPSREEILKLKEGLARERMRFVAKAKARAQQREAQDSQMPPKKEVSDKADKDDAQPVRPLKSRSHRQVTSDVSVDLAEEQTVSPTPTPTPSQPSAMLSLAKPLSTKVPVDSRVPQKKQVFNDGSEPYDIDFTSEWPRWTKYQRSRPPMLFNQQLSHADFLLSNPYYNKRIK